MSEGAEKEEKSLNSAFAGLCIVVIYVWFFTWSSLSLFVDKFEDRGLFGDMFGSINSLFSGFAFAGIIYAILLQRIEIKIQREDLKLTRDELAGQRREFEKQNKTLKRQRFENTFFQMLSLHNDIVNSMSSGTGEDEIKGRSLLKSVATRLIHSVSHVGTTKVSEWDFNQVNTGYNHFYEKSRSHLGIFFRNLYRIFKFVDESDLAEADKRFYTNIIRAQFSDQELQLLFYNCLNDKGENFKAYVEKYALLDNLSASSVPFFQEAVRMYKVSAFGSGYPT